MFRLYIVYKILQFINPLRLLGLGGTRRGKLYLAGLVIAGLAALNIHIVPDWLAPVVHTVTGVPAKPQESRPAPTTENPSGGIISDLLARLTGGKAAAPTVPDRRAAAAPGSTPPPRPVPPPRQPAPFSYARLFAAYADPNLTPAQFGRLPNSPLPPAIPANVRWRRIERVLDGDTLVIDGQTVRILGIDAPESGENDHLRRELERIGAKGNVREMLALGQEATRFVRQVEGRACWLEYEQKTRDQYGRILAHVRFEDNSSFGEIIVYQGFAKTYMAGNSRYLKRFLQLQDEAMRRRHGLWGAQ